MKKFINLILLFLLSTSVMLAQQQKRYNYGTAAAKIENGSTSMQVSSSVYSTQNLQAGNYKSQLGFLSILATNNAADSLALVDLYNATNPGDTTWNVADGWLTAPLDQWHGVGLNAEGRVNYLDLNNNNLTGTLPESLKDLDSLESFYFYVNPNLEGDLFDFLSNYPNLQRVSAHDCAFTGIILPEVFRPNLLEIRVFNNQLTGEIPAEIGNSPLMDQFHVANNLLTGTIPSTISELKHVRELNLSENNITGNIPPEIGQMDSLQFLFLENMSLEGVVPTEILNCPSLIEFWFSGNNLSGTLPDVLNMPNFRALQAGGNTNLLIDLPDNIGELTQLQFLSIWNTRPNGGEFPEGIYNLTNLYGLDLSEQQFTGTIDDRIGNLTNLSSLYLRNNLLEDAFPVEINAAENLNTFDISSNNFDFMPDISSMPNLQNVNLSLNQFQFESLIPFLGVNDYSYSPQRQIGEIQEFSVSIGGNINLSTDILDYEQANYQWIVNGDSLSNATSENLELSNFSISKGGQYFLSASHPDLPELQLNSAQIILKIDTDQRRWYVDNNENRIADFRNINQAIQASNVGDTLYIAGSSEPYFGASLTSSRVLLGPGYFLAENQNTQYNKESAFIGGTLNITNNITVGGNLNGSSTKVYGLEANRIFLQNVVSTEDTLSNVDIEGVKTNRILIGGSTKNLNITNSFVGEMDILGESLGTLELSSYRQNNTINNNIIRKIRPFDGSVGFSNEITNASNIDFSFNTIDTIAVGIENFVVENSLIRSDESLNLSSSGSFIGDYSSLLQNNSGTFSIDNDFAPLDNGISQGAFAGANPYQLSGLPPIPRISNIEIGTRLSAKLNINSNSTNNISRIRYLYRRNNQSSQSFNLSGFDLASEVEVEFLPNRSVIQANQTYDLVFQAIDELGKRSHRTYIPYEAIAANLSGSVVDIDNINVNEGNVRLFAINPYANKYDTAAVQSLNGSNTFNFANLILGDYIILADPDNGAYPNLLPTYLGNTIDWQLASTLALENNIPGVRIEVDKEPEPLTDPGSEISGALQEEYEEADSSLRVLPRRRVSGAGVSVRRVGVSNKPENSLRLLDDDYELVAYMQTNDNGEFNFSNLPSGDYRIRIEYPGVETDQAAEVNFNLSGQLGEVVSVEALVEDGQITVKETGRVNSTKTGEVVRFSFYPNPANRILNLKLENSDRTQKLTIIDLKGTIHAEYTLENEQSQININNLKSGIYIIKLKDEDGNYILSKMIKN